MQPTFCAITLDPLETLRWPQVFAHRSGGSYSDSIRTIGLYSRLCIVVALRIVAVVIATIWAQGLVTRGARIGQPKRVTVSATRHQSPSEFPSLLFLSYCETCGLETGPGHLSRQVISRRALALHTYRGSLSFPCPVPSDPSLPASDGVRRASRRPSGTGGRRK